MPLFSQRLETRRLNNSDMKKLVHVLSGVPNRPTPDGEDSYYKHTKDAIKALPSRLRAAYVSSTHNKLCCIHKGLNHHLINNIWAWVKHEFEGAIGHFLYPIIMSGILTPYQETTVRQLEPVLQMWREDFDLAASAPPGHLPIDGGVRWKFQEDGCHACMLARIGSDMTILNTLFMGMVGRNRSTQRSFFGAKEIKQKRLRFVRYWMQSHQGGTQELYEAYELGVEMKNLRIEAKKRLGCSGQSLFYKRNSIQSRALAARAAEEGAKANVRASCDVHGWFPAEHFSNQQPTQQPTRYLNTSNPIHSFLSPFPSPPYAADPTLCPLYSPIAANPYALSDCYSVAPGSCTDSLAPTAPAVTRPSSTIYNFPPARPCSSVYSVASRSRSHTYSIPSLTSCSTIQSYDGPRPGGSAPPACLCTPNAPGYMAPWVMPVLSPRPQSMYGSFSDAAFDRARFDDADASPPPSPLLRDSSVGSKCTQWGDLY